MRPIPPGWLVGLFLAVLVLGGGAVAAGIGPAGVDGDTHGISDVDGFDAVVDTAPDEGPALLIGDDGIVDPARSTDDDITMRTQLRQVDLAGEYGATTRFAVPDRVSRIEVTLPTEAKSVEATGFETDDGTTYEWDGSTDEPWLRYRVDANRTSEPGPLAGDGDHLFVDTDEWGLVRVPNLRVGWGWRGADVRLHRETAVDGEGAAGDVVAYLGPGEEHVREAHGQRFRLVVPEAADMEEPPEAVLDAFADGSDALRVGSRDPSVFVVAAPTDDVAWAVRGLQTGPADMWVRDLERLDDPENVWMHEYVHSRQGYQANPSARWFTEGSATYYAALLTLERGDVDFDTFRRVLARGERSPQSGSVLADPTTWQNNADYTKGALVAGEVDRRVRLATDGEATLATVFRGMNARDEPVDGAAVLGLVDDAGGSAVAAEADRFTTTEAVPSMWDREAHDEAFGRLPARIGYSIAADDAVRASGSYRDRPVAREPVVLVTGETLELAVEIENTGGTGGEYDLTMVEDGRVIESRDGRIGAGETITERFEREFDSTGDHEINVGGERLSVVVREPAEPTVVDVDVSPAAFTLGETATVTATVRNDARLPARGTFAVAVDGEEREPREVFLDVDGVETLEWAIQPEHDGEVTVRVGDRSRTISVSPTPTPTEPGETATRTPGFGPATAVIAIAAVILAVLGRRR
ncbi:putative glycyl aminopeptidase [Halalkaliarchaeum desulfuricum]|uniref:Putative glycyl aminopeptidase n=1 Tax=Halalkaliarchaeum desulfuricum TaxID=2055893 RepID=A0A343TG72_9EURY|nr:hypothetical protein [Halalkaliarchaeum desulfuricum]AUX08094.1 putative glycyl aminopeptidase [Halalkaliarchaeum desulfuricum]